MTQNRQAYLFVIYLDKAAIAAMGVMHQFSQSNKLPHFSIKPIPTYPLGQGEGLLLLLLKKYEAPDGGFSRNSL